MRPISGAAITVCTSPERRLACVVQVSGAARAHHGYLCANARATRMKLLVHDGFGVWCCGALQDAYTPGASCGRAKLPLLVQQPPRRFR